MNITLDNVLEKSTYVNKLIVDEFKISMENTGGDTLLLNGKNEIHNRDSNKNANKWCWVSETSSELHIFKLHSALDNTSPHFAWDCKNTRIPEIRTFGCDIYPNTSYPKTLYGRTQEV